MKPYIWTLCAGSAILLGCQDSNSPQPPTADDLQYSQRGGSTTGDISAAAEDVGEEIGDAFEATAKLAEKSRAEFADEMNDNLQQFDEEIAQLQQQSQDLKGKAEQQWKEHLSDLREKRAKAADQFEELQATSAESYEEIKSTLNTTWTELEKELREAEANLKDAIKDS